MSALVFCFSWEEKGEEEEEEERGDAVRGFDIKKNSCEVVMGEGYALEDEDEMRGSAIGCLGN